MLGYCHIQEDFKCIFQFRYPETARQGCLYSLLGDPLDYLQEILKMIIECLTGYVAGLDQILYGDFVDVFFQRQSNKGFGNLFFDISRHG